MADMQALSCGLAGSCKSARQGLGFPGSEAGAAVGTLRPYLPPDIVRLIDALVRAWECAERRRERAEILRGMNGGNLGMTLCDAADAGALLDTRLLLAAGADAGAENGWALRLACLGGHLRVAEALLDAGGTLTPRHRNVALGGAAAYGRTACCELLLGRGADVHWEQDSALRAAARRGRLETVALLLDRGADARSEQALRGATERHHGAVIALLMARRRGDGASTHWAS